MFYHIWGRTQYAYVPGLHRTTRFSSRAKSKAVEFAIRLGLATNAELRLIASCQKELFLPGSPKGYQISMYELPLAEDGFIEIWVDGKKKRIKIIRIHLEEDAGKLKHGETQETASFSYVDLTEQAFPWLRLSVDLTFGLLRKPVII